MTVIRYVHHQLKGAVMPTCAVPICVIVAYGVRDASAERYGFWQALGGMLALGVLGGLVSLCPLKWVGDVASFKSAHHVADSDVPRGQVDLWRYFFRGHLLPVMTVCTLIVSSWFPWFALAPLVMTVERLMLAGYGIRWERKHGVVLWWGEVKGQPFVGNQLQYSSPRQA